MNILLIDDDKLICTSLKIILESDPSIHVLETGYDGRDAVSLYKTVHPDILLMDIQMKDLNGIDAAKIILSEFPDAKILFLTTFLDDKYIVEALNAGAKGYILKQNYESIVPSIKAVFSGQNVYGDEIMEKLPSIINKNDAFEYTSLDITEKEAEIIEKVAEGLNNKEISDILCLSEGTVRNYISNILNKLDLRDRTQLAIFYYKHKR